MNKINVLPAVLLLLSFVLCIGMSRKPEAIVAAYTEPLSAFQRRLRLLPLLPLLAMSLINTPLPIFYLLLYTASCAPVYASRTKNHWAWMAANVCFLAFAAVHLIVLGLLALCIPTDLRSVLAADDLRAFSLIVVTVLAALFTPIVTDALRKNEIQALFVKTEEMRLFARFMGFCICAVLFDSVPCLFFMPTRFVPAFLIGSNALLLIMAFLFARHVYSIAQQAHRKDEYLRLQEEAVAQHSRTARLEREAYLDALTGIYTRQYVLTNMSDMLKSGEAFALAFLDLDGLKKVNDHEGHAAGDQYLQRFAAQMKQDLRANDIFARYGGDEFLILFPDSTTQAASQCIARLQRAASSAPPDGWGIPFSYGLIQTQAEQALTAEEWIARADRIMYDDKKRRHVSGEGVPSC